LRLRWGMSEGVVGGGVGGGRLERAWAVMSNDYENHEVRRAYRRFRFVFW
jgi:hypothetical protein